MPSCMPQFSRKVVTSYPARFDGELLNMRIGENYARSFT
jgi:hypothetical protein